MPTITATVHQVLRYFFVDALASAFVRVPPGDAWSGRFTSFLEGLRSAPLVGIAVLIGGRAMRWASGGGVTTSRLQRLSPWVRHLIPQSPPDILARCMEAEYPLTIKVVLVLDLGPEDRLIAAVAEGARTKAGKGSEWSVRRQETVRHLAANLLLEG